MYYDDFYDEPSEFDMQIEEFKESLRAAVKEEFQERMKKLEEENNELREIKKNWNEKIRELDNKKLEMNRAIRNAKDEARRERLSTLLEAFTKTAWGIKYTYEFIREKCNKCDEQGYIHYKSPQGNDMKEGCNCRKRVCVYKPQEAEIIQFDDYKGVIKPTYGYERNDNYDNYDSYKKTAKVYEGEDFKDIDYYSGIVFLDKDVCQKYCDYMNKKALEDALK